MKLDEQLKEELIGEIKTYLAEELDIEIGGFDAQFFLEFLERRLACHYYNQGLADALHAAEAKMAEVGDLVYELEQSPAQ